jgi:flagellum-specific ATP synthase
LSRDLAQRGHFPAIDVPASISRLAPEIATEPELRAAAAVRDLISAHREAQDLIQVGAYVAGSDPRVDAACAGMPQIDAFLRQGLNERARLPETKARLSVLARLRDKATRQ